MTDHVWSSEDARINGTAIEAGSPFVEAVTAEAHSKGYRNFRVLMNGNELNQGDAPATVPAGADIQVLPHDKAGK